MTSITSPLITLTTDFGNRDGYPAAMKGAILTVCPGARVIDITHEIDAHDVAQASQVLASAVPYFPPDTVHVAVVDPGVGSERLPLLSITPNAGFVGPDNGVFTDVLRGLDHPILPANQVDFIVDHPGQTHRATLPDDCAAYVIDKPDLWRQPVSQTFHGRDIFAPVAGHLGSGVSSDKIGTVIEYVEVLPNLEVRRRDGRIDGTVVSVDRFGNLVTNIRIERSAKVSDIEVAGRRITTLSTFYTEAAGLLAIVGSHGANEIAWTQDSAARRLGVGVGTRVTVRDTL
ncbi:MAG: SAM-dependent chlorinase/fluorinase [SAR202 cluster bacterium]|nr:SAM-dependent chlorinase/fluorinase [SAR202 cluster bacterium]